MELQKRIVSLVKLCDVRGILEVIESLLTVPESSHGVMASVKMALTMSATILEAFKKHNSLQDLYSVSLAILNIYPDVSKQENVQLAVLKMQLALGDLNSAVDTARKCTEARLRMFSSILERCSDIQNPQIALEVVMDVRNRGLLLTEKEVEFIIRCGLTVTDLDKFLTEISDEFEEPFSLPIFEHLSPVTDIQCDCGIFIDPHGDSLCPITGLKLRRTELTDNELADLISMTCSLSTEAGCSNAVDFKSVVSSQMHVLPDVVLDGANIAHVNQNFVDGYFRFDQIEDVLSDFGEMNCLVVLHEKWLSPDKDLRLFATNPDQPTRMKKRKKAALPPLGTNPMTHALVYEEPMAQESPSDRPIARPVPIALLDNWRKKRVLFQVPHGQNDDWFWMHICCVAIREGKRDLMIVSNDLMRDHYWRMQHPRAFSHFVKNHVCRYAIQFGEDGVNHYKFMYPSKHSICMQRNEVVIDEVRNIVWHIPYKAEANEVRWTIVRMKSW
jgi:hypothetical protein